MLTDLAGPGVMGSSGCLENENSYTIDLASIFDKKAKIDRKQTYNWRVLLLYGLFCNHVAPGSISYKRADTATALQGPNKAVMTFVPAGISGTIDA